MTQPIPISTPMIIDETMNIGKITPSEERIPMSFPETMLFFKEAAFALKENGAELLLIEGMTALPELRAAVIAAKKTELPIFVLIDVNDNGETDSGAKPLALLICLQELGISAFGLQGGEELPAMLAEIYPYAKVPLLARISDEASVAELLQSGVECFDLRGGNSVTLLIWKNTIESFAFINLSLKKEDTSLMLAGEITAFFLSADNIEISEPLACSLDMADELLSLSATHFDLINVVVNTTDDAYEFSENAHMASRPILFHSDSDIALKAALLTYHGRAMVDKHCEIENEALKKIADKYGAVVY